MRTSHHFRASAGASRPVAARLVAIAVLLAASAGVAPPAAGEPAAPIPTTPAAGAAKPSPGVDVFEGAMASLAYKTAKQGGLAVAVERATTVSGTEVTVTYERYTRCGDHPVGGGGDSIYTCRLAWREQRTVGADSFTFDPRLESASFRGTVRGTTVTVSWRGAGETTRQENENGNLLVEMRDASITATWGSARFGHPHGPQTTSMLYRRLTAVTS